MKYMGSKSKVANEIVPIIHRYLSDNQLNTYVEPFVGGANIIDKVICPHRVGCDKQVYLIELYKNLDKLETLPNFITKEHYSDVRECYNNSSDKYEDWYIGAIGFLSSYNGRFFDGGYSGKVVLKSGNVRNYYEEAKNNLESQINDLRGIEWKIGDYKETCSNYKHCLIYCDPPYKDTKQYGSSRDFSHDEFFEWCRDMSKDNIVLISEHTAPSDFKSIWSHNIKRTINSSKTILSVENLFVYSDDSRRN